MLLRLSFLATGGCSSDSLLVLLCFLVVEVSLGLEVEVSLSLEVEVSLGLEVEVSLGSRDSVVRSLLLRDRVRFILGSRGDSNSVCLLSLSLVDTSPFVCYKGQDTIK
jgi:hypothetical protein